MQADPFCCSALVGVCVQASTPDTLECFVGHCLLSWGEPLLVVQQVCCQHTGISTYTANAWFNWLTWTTAVV